MVQVWSSKTDTNPTSVHVICWSPLSWLRGERGRDGGGGGEFVFNVQSTMTVISHRDLVYKAQSTMTLCVCVCMGGGGGGAKTKVREGCWRSEVPIP